MFTKKHMEAIASVLKRTKGGNACALESWEEIVEEMASMLYASNDRFDNQKFFKACDYWGGYRDE